MRLLLAVLVLLASSLAGAEVLPPDVRDGVARAIFERAIRLYHEGKTSDARSLFTEAAAASPDGPYAETARSMVARADARLGKKKVPPPPASPHTTPLDPYADAPIIEVRSPPPPRPAPPTPKAATPVAPKAPESLLDPYADAGVSPASPLDPYADAPRVEAPLDPYADPQPARPRPKAPPKASDRPLDPYGELE